MFMNSALASKSGLIVQRIFAKAASNYTTLGQFRSTHGTWDFCILGHNELLHCG